MITIHGASDDLVEVEGCEGADEFYAHGGVPESQVCWRGDLVAPGGTEQVRVSALFDNGVWIFALGQTDESVPFPEWGNGISQHESGHSALVTIDAPEGTRLTNVWPVQS